MSNRVAYFRLPHCHISTAWLYGIPHTSYKQDNVPCYYETALLTEDGWDVVDRYPTLTAAQAGHKSWIEKECQRYTGVDEVIYRLINWWRTK